MSKCLMIDPGLFLRYHQAFRFISAVPEWVWATFVSIATALHIVGWMLSWSTSWSVRRLGGVLRAVGLDMAGIFWVVFGMGLLAADPNTITSVPFVLLGLVAWSVVLRWPAELRR